MIWHCAVCAVDHEGRPHVEKQVVGCCLIYVRACDKIETLIADDIAKAFVEGHARTCRKAKP